MNVGIIGSGASGMMAAIIAAKNGHNVTVLEHNLKSGNKILQTGNGKCNYTNKNISEKDYSISGRNLFKAVYTRFDNNDTLDFFESIGIVPYEKNGYFYPKSEQAKSIVQCLLYEMSRLNVRTVYDCDINSIKKEKKFIVSAVKEDFLFDRLIIAAGSNAVPKSGSDGSGYGYAIKLGHTVKKPLPALCGLKCDGGDFKQISGVRCQAKVTLNSNNKIIMSDFGELQLTDYGISGIPVFQISSEALRLVDSGERVTVNVDYAFDYTEIELKNYLNKRITTLADKSIASFLDGMFNSKLCDCFLSDIIKKYGADLELNSVNSKEIIDILIKNIKHSEYIVKGHRGFDNCQVCSGGVLCDEVKETLESKIVNGLYFAGEILDVDGKCGGYNLQWAWSSGYIAGQLL